MNTENVDVAVVGGGMVGATLAVALSDAGVNVVLVERRHLETLVNPGHDGRGSAIAAGSQRILSTLSLWTAMEPHAEPILDIRVADNRSLLFVHFDHEDLGEGPMGWIVENAFIREALFAGLASSGVLVADGVEVRSVEYHSHGATLALGDGRRLGARLVVAADGPASPLRRGAGIDVMRWSYPQDAIVCSIHHELPHQGIAHEHFLPAGPFAILPMTGNRSSIVWTERRERASAIMGLDEAGFATELRSRTGDFLGSVKPAPGRWRHALGALHAHRYTAPGLALVGDAAHTIHPIAGQGFNLGLRDVAALSEVIIDHMRLGLDPGSPGVLARYERWRRNNNLAMLAVTDLLNRLFSNDRLPLRVARRLGLAAVDRMAPLKRQFMREAAGISGQLPRLAKGPVAKGNASR